MVKVGQTVTQSNLNQSVWLVSSYFSNHGNLHKLVRAVVTDYLLTYLFGDKYDLQVHKAFFFSNLIC